MMICVECAIQAVLQGKDPHAACRFDEEPAEHLRRLHPEPVSVAQRERDLQEICDRLNTGDVATHKALKTPMGRVAHIFEEILAQEPGNA